MRRTRSLTDNRSARVLRSLPDLPCCRGMRGEPTVELGNLFPMILDKPLRDSREVFVLAVRDLLVGCFGAVLRQYPGVHGMKVEQKKERAIEQSQPAPPRSAASSAVPVATPAGAVAPATAGVPGDPDHAFATNKPNRAPN